MRFEPGQRVYHTSFLFDDIEKDLWVGDVCWLDEKKYEINRLYVKYGGLKDPYPERASLMEIMTYEV